MSADGEHQALFTAVLYTFSKPTYPDFLPQDERMKKEGSIYLWQIYSDNFKEC